MPIGLALADRAAAFTRQAELAAEANAANTAKSRFLANMSHEIRTPLNGAPGSTELLQGSQLDNDQAHQVDMIDGSAEALLSLLNGHPRSVQDRSRGNAQPARAGEPGRRTGADHADRCRSCRGVVKNGREALQVVKQRRPDLLILDISMPEMTGSQALDVIRRDPALYDVPVLMLTGRRSQADEDIAIKAGATEYLRKPFDPDRLVVTVEALLAKAARHAPAAEFRRI